MSEFAKIAKTKVDETIWHLFSTGIVLLLLGVLVVWTDIAVKLVVGVIIILVAYILIYLSYKLRHLKKEIEKHFNV
jgi:formate/nitrite transporter FocA (FNT family)